MSVSWTKEQREVIESRGQNLLVSAAAGSGKTAVLVERIMGRILDEADPLDVTELLVVTYTEAAAAEMRERIQNAIERQLQKNPDHEHLRKQSALLYQAQISTIHGFCLSVIRDYFYTIDLDPSFRVGEEGELTLLQQDTLKILLEEQYEAGEPSFLRFVESYGTGKDDRGIEELIRQVYTFSRSYPNPKQWLAHCVKAYDEKKEKEAVWEKLALEQLRQEITEERTELEGWLSLCREADGPYMYEETIREDLAVLKELQEAEALEKLCAGLQRLRFSTLKANRDKNVSESLADQVKTARNRMKEQMKKLTAHYPMGALQEMKEDMQLAGQGVRELVRLVNVFEELFACKKKERGLIDFSDMEHLALAILTQQGDGGRIPGAVAKEYQSRFREIMIDEYQDSNYLQEAILTSVAGDCNRFMVGDVKQSIYRFRLARPELFLEKYATYEEKNSRGRDRRIDLHKNFRSREQVLSGVNFLFAQLMRREVGGILYDEQAALYTGAEYAPCADKETELLLIDSVLDKRNLLPETTQEGDEAEVEETLRELEARAVAGRIHQLVENHQIWDEKSRSYRLVKYGDIVILTRSLQGFVQEFSQVLGREGIPVQTNSKTGYFQTIEIGMLLDYCKVLDNAKQDIPLAAVLTSPFGNLTAVELGKIRGKSGKEIPFYEAVESYEREGKEEKLKEKLHRVLEQIRKFRNMLSYTPTHELLQRIFQETGYLEYISAMPGGRQRRANLELLMQKARAFEKTSYHGLFHFVRYVEQLEKYQVDYGEAGVTLGNENVVRMMSIHKSKGLEFPVVIVAGLGKQFHMQDTRGTLLLHPELGIGLNGVNPTERIKTSTMLKAVMEKELQKANLGEELRVLYVALTRAKEKLILTGTISDLEKRMGQLIHVGKREEVSLSVGCLTRGRSFLDWVLSAMVRSCACAPLLEKYSLSVPFGHALFREKASFVVKQVSLKPLVAQEMEREKQCERKLSALYQEARTEEEKELQACLERQLTFRYPFATQKDWKLKFTVSELKKQSKVLKTEEILKETEQLYQQERKPIPLVPRFVGQERKLSGASRGTAYHRFLELLDFGKDWTEETLKEELNRLVKQEKLELEMGQCIDCRQVLAFLSAELGQRMKQAARQGVLKMEQPFVLGVDASQVYSCETGTETVLVQGIIDVYFEEGEDLILVDYKTDSVKEGQELVRRYETQLAYYAQALEQLTEKKVKEKWIYSFSLSECILVS